MRVAIGRLTRRPEFLRVARGRCKWVAPGLILQARRLEGAAGAAECRVGLTASRKVGSAVERNRARRRLRAAVDAVMPHHGTPGLDYVVIARRETLRRPFSDLRQDLEHALKQVARHPGRTQPAAPSPGTQADTSQ